MKKNDVPPVKRFADALLFLGRTQSVATAFDDFLDFALLFIKWWDRRPEEYVDLKKKYPSQNAHEQFVEAFLAMAEIADHGGAGFKDPFGDFYMEHLSNGGAGQFFTPEPICDFMAQLQVPGEMPDGASVGDPCCGSGRMLLSAAKINRKAQFYAADLDLTCCKMTLLNFLLNTMCGEVAWMNSLSLEHWKSWKVSKVMDAGGMYLPYYQEIVIENAVFPVMHANTVRTRRRENESPDPSERVTTPKPTATRSRKGRSTNQLFFDFGE